MKKKWKNGMIIGSVILFAIIWLVFLSSIEEKEDDKIQHLLTGVNNLSYREAEITQGTVYRMGEISIGVRNVREDYASLSVWNGNEEKTFVLNKSQSAEFDNVSMTLVSTSIDRGFNYMPGSDSSSIMLIISQKA